LNVFAVTGAALELYFALVSGSRRFSYRWPGLPAYPSSRMADEASRARKVPMGGLALLVSADRPNRPWQSGCPPGL